MKYDKLISDFLASSSETVDHFSERAGVHRSSVYRAMNGQGLQYRVLEKVIDAAGFTIEAIPKKSSEPSHEPD